MYGILTYLYDMNTVLSHLDFAIAYGRLTYPYAIRSVAVSYDRLNSTYVIVILWLWNTEEIVSHSYDLP